MEAYFSLSLVCIPMHYLRIHRVKFVTWQDPEAWEHSCIRMNLITKPFDRSN
jgi:hypothetical protein